MIYIQDVENIPLRRTKEILNKLEKLNMISNIKQYIAVSKREILEEHKEKVNDLDFKFVLSNKDADSLLKFCLKIKQENNDDFIIVSSDSDFVEIVKELIQNNKKVIWVANHMQSKRILMKSSLTEKNLKFVLFDFHKKKKLKKQVKKEIKEENKKSGKLSFSELILLKEQKEEVTKIKKEKIDKQKINEIKQRDENIINKKEKRFRNIIKQIIHAVYSYIHGPIEKCQICGETKQCAKHHVEKVCFECEHKLIEEIIQRKELNHNEKLEELKTIVEKERKEGKIKYYENSMDFLIQRKLNLIT